MRKIFDRTTKRGSMLILYDAYEKLSYSQSGQRGIEREIRDLGK